MYIAIEGIDGSGTTTHTARLVERLNLMTPTLQVHEPTGSPIGTLVREYFEAKHGDLPGWRTMLHLFQADRELLMEKTILPALQEGKHVVSDRNWLSTLIYQTTSAELEGADPAEVSNLIVELNAHLPKPSKTIVLTVPFERTLERRKSRAGTAATEDYFERREAFMRSVHKKYSEVSGEGLIRIDADRNLDKVENDVFSAVAEEL